MTDVKKNLSRNLSHLRKLKGLTQSELAEKINYSDKTVSKWENGDAVPDVETLCLIAEVFGVGIDTLVKGDAEKLDKEADKKPHTKRNKIIITLLSISVVWIVATVIYFNIGLIFKTSMPWIAFIWATPISFIVALVFNSIWGKRALNFVIISFLVWTLLTSTYLQLLLAINTSIWQIFILGAPLQVAVVFWSQLRSDSKKSRRNS